MSIVVRPMMRRSVMLLPPALVSRRSHVQCLAVSGLVNVCRRDRAGAWQVPTPISPAGRLAALAPLSAVGDGRQGREPGIKSARRRETRAHFSTLVKRIRFAVSKSSTVRSEEHTSELQSHGNVVCLLLRCKNEIITGYM